MRHYTCASNLNDPGYIVYAHRSPMVSTPWINREMLSLPYFFLVQNTFIVSIFWLNQRHLDLHQVVV